MNPMPTTSLGPLTVSRFIVGGNPFSGGSHQSAEVSQSMREWWTVARIKGALAECERLGVRAGNEDLQLRPAEDPVDPCGACGLANTMPAAAAPENQDA